jgi:hypothetical protein
MDDCHLGYTKNFLKKTLELVLYKGLVSLVFISLDGMSIEDCLIFSWSKLVKRFKLKTGLRAKVGWGGVQVCDLVSTIM